MCTPMFITALFTIARKWKQPRCPLADEWIRKCGTYTQQNITQLLKKNAFQSDPMRWMKLEPIILSKVKSERETPMQCINTYIWNLRDGNDDPICKTPKETQM